MIKLNVITPQGTQFADNQVVSLTLPTEAGVITVLENHEKLIANLIPGVLHIKASDYERQFSIESGIIEIREESEVNLLVDSAQRNNDTKSAS